MTLQDNVRENSRDIAATQASLESCQAGRTECKAQIADRLDDISSDVKILVTANGTRQGQIGELKGKLFVICAVVLAILATVLSIKAISG